MASLSGTHGKADSYRNVKQLKTVSAATQLEK